MREAAPHLNGASRLKTSRVQVRTSRHSGYRSPAGPRSCAAGGESCSRRRGSGGLNAPLSCNFKLKSPHVSEVRLAAGR